MWTDSHCHLQYEEMPEGAIERANAAGVTRLICVGTDQAESRKAIDIANAAENVWATVGLHPHEAKHGIEGLEELVTEPKVVAVGECGLDYFYEHSPRQQQQDVFSYQIELAKKHDLALIIHTRDAWDDTFAMLASVGAPSRTVFHCFTGGPAELDRCLEVGACISFSGIVTFKSGGEVRAAAGRCPKDRILVETDAPYLSPEPFRGRPNEPAMVPPVGKALARAQNVDIAAIEAATWETTQRVLSLHP